MDTHETGQRSAYLALLDDPVIIEMARKLTDSGRSREQWISPFTGEPTVQFRLLAAHGYRTLCARLGREPIVCDGGPPAAVLALAYPTPCAGGGPTNQPRSRYLEHDKQRAARAKTAPVGDFLEWLRSQGWRIAHGYENGALSQVSLSPAELLAHWQDIDLDRIEAERQDMLAAMRGETARSSAEGSGEQG